MVRVCNCAANVFQDWGDLVTALRKALQGRLDEDAQQKLKGKYRRQIVQAFIRVSDDNLLTAIGAAWVIGELLLIEVLSALKRKVRSPFTPLEVHKTCRKAMARWQPFAHLSIIPFSFARNDELAMLCRFFAE